jgi:hypothetical protein
MCRSHGLRASKNGKESLPLFEVLLPLAVGLALIGWGVFGRSFRRRRTGQPDPHPTRVRIVLVV